MRKVAGLLFISFFLVFPWQVFSLLAADESTVTLEVLWNPNPEENVVGYKIHWGTEPDVYLHSVDVGLPVTHQADGYVHGFLPDVPDSPTLFLALTAYGEGGAGESDYSTELIWSRYSGTIISLEIVWNPNPERNVAGYKVHWGTEEGVYHNTYDMGLLATDEDGFVHGQVPGIPFGPTIFLALTAYGEDGLGESGYSTELVWTPPYEDAEDGDTVGWYVYDATPAGASIRVVDDVLKNSKVIETVGSGTANGYKRVKDDGSVLGSYRQFIVQWSQRFSSSYVIYISVQTTLGHRYIYYTARNDDKLAEYSGYIHHGLGSESLDNVWHTFARDLQADLKDAEPGNEIISVDAFLVRGSGRLDDMMLLQTMPRNIDSDNDGLTNYEEDSVYHTNQFSADSDGDGLSDKLELAYWGDAWNQDSDNDGVINLLDYDSDNDGFSDGVEVANNSDPANRTSIPQLAPLVYEDGEDSYTDGWLIYDNDPEGATITSLVEVDGHEGHVISLDTNNNGVNNGFRLKNSDGTSWNSRDRLNIQWSHNFSEYYIVYVLVDTTDGYRYLYYTSHDENFLGDGSYVHHGLMAESQNGQWHTYSRDLQADLDDSQAGVVITAVNGFYVKGTGYVDDIMVHQYVNGEIDSDNDGLTNDEESGLGTDPLLADSDIDGIADGEEWDLWDGRFDNAAFLDSDGDGIINLLDFDSDNDSFADGVEYYNNPPSDPADSASLPQLEPTLYEDGTGSQNWNIYDNSPEGATVSTVEDDERGTVVAFQGSSTSNGYRHRGVGTSSWQNRDQFVIDWWQKFSTGYTVYISTETEYGHRYIYYTASDTDRLDATTGYVHHGIGSDTRDGMWHNFRRDLAADLADAEPGNEILWVNGFYLRGDGRVDDIRLDRE